MASTERLSPIAMPVSATDHDSESTRAIAAPKLMTASFILIIIALNLSIFCVALMNVIIAVAIPKITDEFHSLDDIGFYAAAYLLPTCAFQPHYGKLYARYSAKWIILLALAFFEAGLLASSFCQSSSVFIFGRTLAGVGAAGVYSGALYIIALLTPPEKTPAFQSTVGIVIGIASVTAPLLGGWLVDHFDWRWCFIVDIPGGLIAGIMLLALLKLPPVQRESKTKLELIKMFDPPGTMFFLISIVCLLLALEWGGLVYPWSSTRILLLFVFFVVLFIGFAIVQLCTGDNATIPIRILRQRTIAALSFFILCLFAQFACDVYFIPLYFQGVRMMSATDAGIRMVAFIAAMVVFLIAAGVTSSKLGHYMPFFYASTFFMAIGNGMLTTLTPQTPTIWYTVHQLAVGAGTGLGLQMPATAVQAVLPDKDFPVGLATVLFFEFLGGAIFVAAGNNIFNNQLRHMNGPSNGATTMLDGSVAKQDLYMAALRWPFRLSLILACLSILGVIYLERKKVKARNDSTSALSDHCASDGTNTSESFELKEAAPLPSLPGPNDFRCYGCDDRPPCVLHSSSDQNGHLFRESTVKTAHTKRFQIMPTG